MLCLRLLLVALAVSIAGRAVGQATAPAAEVENLQQRLDRLAAELDAQRVGQHIPGLSVAIVRDDIVVMARGFGKRDLERDLPATADTIYAAGSTTKAFTAALVAMLVDDRELNWDDPVTKHLPELAFHDPVTTNLATLRDLLAHRTGLMGMDLLWLGGESTWSDMLPCIARAEPTAGFRERFQYNNVMYVAAGRAAAAATHKPWGMLIEERIFRPLGMSHSSTSIAAAREEVHLARGYRWRGEDQWQALPMRSIDNAAPAGAINSNVIDMAKWIRLLLREGKLGDDVLISPERLNEMWTSEVPIAPGTSYGLGWMLSSWNGQRVVSHSGGIDGFTAHVALMPETGVGCVLLANAQSTLFPALATNLIFEELLREDAAPAGEDAAAGADEYARYLGTYRFEVLGVDVTVLERDGQLAVDIPRQMVYELGPPDARGVRSFRGFPEITIAFEESADGAVVAMTMDQRGEVYRLPRQGVAETVVELDEVARSEYPGRYLMEQFGQEFEVRVEDGALAVDVPGQMAYALNAPDEEGWWAFRAVPSIAVRFERDAGGAVAAITFRQLGRETRLPRLGMKSVERLPAAYDVMEAVHLARGSDAYEQTTNMRFTGTVDFVNQGVQGTITVLVAGYDRYVMLMEYPPFGWTEKSWVAWIGAKDSAFGPMEELEGALLDQLKHEHPALLLAPWSHWYDDVRVIRVDVVDGRDVHVLRVKPKGFPMQTLHLQALDGKLLRSEGQLVTPGGGLMPVQTVYEDYRLVEGATFPFRITTEDKVNGRVVVQFDAVTVNETLTEEPWFMVDGQGLRKEREKKGSDD
ncbi:MAG: serine hydrolase [Planctomycetota bacterium]|jgi:CubicO group peptidase (beta-lactamase class C family)